MDAKTYPVTRTEAEWRARLTPEQYHIMREHGTERAGSCALNWEKRPEFSLAQAATSRSSNRSANSTAARAGRASTIPFPGSVETTVDRSVGHDAHRGPLRALRLASRPCFP